MDEIIIFQNTLKRICNEIYEKIGGYESEKVYQRALVYELELLRNCRIEEETNIPFYYENLDLNMHSRRFDIGIYKNNSKNPFIILELKCIDKQLEPWQLSNYLKLTNCRYGFMINFKKLGDHPKDFCANVYNIETNEQITFTQSNTRGCVEIQRFENNFIKDSQSCLGCGRNIPLDFKKPKCNACYRMYENYK